MTHYTTDTYKMKREILNFSKIFSGALSAPNRKFFADMTYGILASQSCLLSKIAHALQEDQKKIYTVDRLSGHLKDGADSKALAAYLDYVRKMAPSEPVVHIDDSDVVKPEGYHFETLGIVRDGSKSTNGKSVYTKGYHTIAVQAGNQRQAAPIVPDNAELTGIVHIPYTATGSRLCRGVWVIHAVQHNPCAGWIIFSDRLHLLTAGKWHIHFIFSFSDNFINRVRIHSPSPP